MVHTTYIIVCILPDSGVGKEEWHKYKVDKAGRHMFQIDLGLAIINYAPSQCPDWMQGTTFVPCDCEKCYFCLNGFTNNFIAHEKNGPT